MGNWDNKTKRAKIAFEHTKLMEEKYSENIKNCIKNTKTYHVDYTFKVPYTYKMQMITINDIDSVGAIFKYAKDNEKLAVLNFASYKNPGGMFINGSKAQEECLCHESFLYNVLKEFDKSYYQYNRDHKERALYLNRALYSPNVTFVHNGIAKNCDVITCASPNWNAASKYCNVTKDENFESLIRRINFVLGIAQENNVDTLILGAYGCGVFGQDPYEVARIFKDGIGDYGIHRIIFAIPDKSSRNHRAFKEIFK